MVRKPSKRIIKYSEAIKKNKASKITLKRNFYIRFLYTIKKINYRWQLGKFCNLFDKKGLFKGHLKINF